MSEGLLEMRGDCELSQFWPDGASDADTIQVLMHVRGASFKFRKDAASPFKTTHVFEEARVRGRVTKEVIDKNGHVTVRLQGIDAPELHYRPSAELKRTEQSTIQHDLYLKWNADYRQPLAETAAAKLATFLKSTGARSLRCVVRSHVDEPNEVFDTYGRFVGEVFVAMNDRAVSVNRWLSEAGWALPAFYNSMSGDEIAALMRASREARVARAGVWGFLADTLRKASMRRTFRGKGAPVRPDEGLVVLPKLFRRLAMWRVNRRAKMYSGALGPYLSQKRIVCFETRDFLAQGVAAMPRDFAEFIGRDGRILAGPEELVFKEDPSELVVAGGGQAKW